MPGAQSTRKHERVAKEVKETVGDSPCKSIFSMTFRGAVSTSARFEKPGGEYVELYAADEADKLLPPLMRKAELRKRLANGRKGRPAPYPVRDHRLPRVPHMAGNAQRAVPLQEPAGQYERVVPLPPNGQYEQGPAGQYQQVVPRPPHGQYQQVYALPQMPEPNFQHFPQQGRSMFTMLVDVYPTASTSQIPYQASSTTTSQRSFSSLSSASNGFSTATNEFAAASTTAWNGPNYDTQLNHH